jgi:serine/threonine-protein phosphatase 2A regulatory subunit B''
MSIKTGNIYIYYRFSIPYSKSLYNKFNKLDVDKNGYLRKEDLAKYSKGLTTIVIDRIFEEYQTYDG